MQLFFSLEAEVCFVRRARVADKDEHKRKIAKFPRSGAFIGELGEVINDGNGDRCPIMNIVNMSDAHYSDFVALVKDAVGLNEKEGTTIFYMDDEGDPIIIVSMEDFEEALKHVMNAKLPFKLRVMPVSDIDGEVKEIIGAVDELKEMLKSMEFVTKIGQISQQLREQTDPVVFESLQSQLGEIEEQLNVIRDRVIESLAKVNKTETIMFAKDSIERIKTPLLQAGEWISGPLITSMADRICKILAALIKSFEYEASRDSGTHAELGPSAHATAGITVAKDNTAAVAGSKGLPIPGAYPDSPRPVESNDHAFLATEIDGLLLSTSYTNQGKQAEQSTAGYSDPEHGTSMHAPITTSAPEFQKADPTAPLTKPKMCGGISMSLYNAYIPFGDVLSAPTESIEEKACDGSESGFDGMFLGSFIPAPAIPSTVSGQKTPNQRKAEEGTEVGMFLRNENLLKDQSELTRMKIDDGLEAPPPTPMMPNDNSLLMNLKTRHVRQTRILPVELNSGASGEIVSSMEEESIESSAESNEWIVADDAI